MKELDFIAMRLFHELDEEAQHDVIGYMRGILRAREDLERRNRRGTGERQKPPERH